MTRKRTSINRSQRSIAWLPVDSRLILPLFSFGHIRGLAKVFIMIEMFLAGFVVIGTITLVALRAFV